MGEDGNVVENLDGFKKIVSPKIKRKRGEDRNIRPVITINCKGIIAFRHKTNHLLAFDEFTGGDLWFNPENNIIGLAFKNNAQGDTSFKLSWLASSSANETKNPVIYCKSLLKEVGILSSIEERTVHHYYDFKVEPSDNIIYINGNAYIKKMITERKREASNSCDGN